MGRKIGNQEVEWGPSRCKCWKATERRQFEFVQNPDILYIFIINVLCFKNAMAINYPLFFNKKHWLNLCLQQKFWIDSGLNKLKFSQGRHCNTFPLNISIVLSFFIVPCPWWMWHVPWSTMHCAKTPQLNDKETNSKRHILARLAHFKGNSKEPWSYE
jgi:hypothetical protein